VIDKLHFPWSPDQIAGHLKRLGIEGFYVCRETIYDFIYSAEGRALQLYRCLRRSFKHRRKRFKRKPRHLRGIPHKWSIHNRPEAVSDRSNFGHWEGDLIIGKDHGSAVGTLVERKSRYVFLRSQIAMAKRHGRKHKRPDPPVSAQRLRFIVCFSGTT